MFAICHTHYSLQTGVGSPKEWAETAVERGYTALAVADVDGLYGAVEFVKAAAAAGLHAIVGATLTLDRDSHCVVLAPDDRAYRQLCRLLSARNLLPNFTLEQVAADLDALLFLARSGGVLRRLARYVAPENLYALAPTDAPSGQPLLWDQVPHTCRRAYVPDAWFLQAEDRVPFDYLRQLRTGTQGRDSLVPWHVGAVLPEAREWARQFPDRRAADELSERCRFRFPFGTVHLPRISLPRQMDAGEYLATLCRLGLDARYATDRRAPAEARLNKELRIIGDSGYADYFLFVNEIFEFARRKRIPCTVRGSAASSIVGHLLGFTDCCPLANGLLFERFMSSARRDCPDIDIDIADFRRDEVIDYCYDHWGREHVAMASAIQFYRARGALRDAGRLLRLPTERISALIEAPDGDRQCPDLYRIAAHLVGRPRHLSVHCAGLIITPVPIRDLTPLAMTAKGIQLTHYDKDQAEAVGLLKIDLLGSSALSVIAEAKEWLVKAGRDWRDAGPIWDYKVNRLFAAGDTLGLHQCESPGMRQLCQAVRPRNQREVAMTLSLIRPGPASSGMKDTFVRRRRGLEEVSHIHPRMAELLGGTYGVMLYQEDVMAVASLAGYSLADAEVLRRAVSKTRDATVFGEERHRFVYQKATAAGIPQDTAHRIWDAVSRFSAYSYCKAHATVYGRLAWIMARLKVHHPREFFASCLNRHQSMYPRRVFVWDALRHGIPVYAPDIVRSEARWVPVRNGVQAGLGVVRGIGKPTVDCLLAERTREPFAGLPDLVRRVPFRKGELERLVLVGALRAWGSRRELLGELREFSQAGRQPHLLPVADDSPMSLLAAQLAYTGIPFCLHVTEWIKGHGTCLAADMPRHRNDSVVMIGVLDATKHLRTQPKSGETAKDMSFVTFEDHTGMFDAVLFPEIHSRLSRLFSHVGPFQLRGRVVEQWGSFSLELADAVSLSLPA